MSKSEFVRSLQTEKIALSPFDVSQRLRIAHGCVSVWKGDEDLPIETTRGYMILIDGHRAGTPEDPLLYQCIVSLAQSKPWQDLVWTKEIIQILDRPEHRTNTKAALAHMLDDRATTWKNNREGPPNVMADKDGITLALGCAIPMGYRQIMREQNYLAKYAVTDLERLFPVPQEFWKNLLSPDFESEFEAAILRCDKQ